MNINIAKIFNQELKKINRQISRYPLPENLSEIRQYDVIELPETFIYDQWSSQEDNLVVEILKSYFTENISFNKPVYMYKLSDHIDACYGHIKIVTEENIHIRLNLFHNPMTGKKSLAIECVYLN